MPTPLIYCKAQRESDLLQRGEVYYQAGERADVMEGFYYFDGENSHGPYTEEDANAEAKYLQPSKRPRLKSRRECERMLFQLQLGIDDETQEAHDIRRAKIKTLLWVIGEKA